MRSFFFVLSFPTCSVDAGTAKMGQFCRKMDCHQEFGGKTQISQWSRLTEMTVDNSVETTSVVVVVGCQAKY